MDKDKKIALVAHDRKKPELLEWVTKNKNALTPHSLFATGTTGSLIHRETSLPVTLLESGPLGGDQQIGARIVEGLIDTLIFFWDPLDALPHDPDVKALLRVAAVWNIPVACNETTADFLISSPLMSSPYERRLTDFSSHRSRSITDA